MNVLPIEIINQLKENELTSKLQVLISYLLLSFREISDGLRNGNFSSDLIGTQNAFGDNQLDVDVKSDLLIFNNLKKSQFVHIASSEENPTEIDCQGNGFSVAFDPLDGSSIIDANFAVGSIVGIWPGSGFLNRLGREMVSSMICQYGPRVTVIIALSVEVIKLSQPVSFELTMYQNDWRLSIPEIEIKPVTKIFAPGNLRAAIDNTKYDSLIRYWITNKYTLRYSGGLVPDVYHILIKKEGVLSNVSSKNAKAKLRLLFEAAPIALIIESAKGSSCVCPSEIESEDFNPVSILDVPITDLDKRVGVCYGSSTEVERLITHLFKS